MATVNQEAAVQRIMDRMIAGYRAADAKAILSCYEQQAVYALDAGSTAAGEPQLRGLFEQIVAMNPQFTFDKHEIVISEDIALHISAYNAALPDGSIHRGLSAAVLRRQTDGEWRMVIDHPSAERLL
ncbi:SgcJ/EcaC family oxidoreductase [Nocardia sp. NPDC005366]|uniref:YybH family protein n=1 Tax=Nocardia sp. NPDC005366 TaxID=3156878 RepID=UPI0033A72BCD